MITRFGAIKLRAKKLLNKNYRKVLPLIYLLLLVLGLLLTLVYAFVPKFVACSFLFGEQFCTPFGIFLMLVVSLPGYIIAGNAFSFIGELPWGISLILVVITSFLFYFLVGFGLDKLKVKRLTPEGLSKLVVVVTFVILLVFILVLL